MCSIAYVNFLFFKIFIKVPTYIFLKIEQCHGVKVKNKDKEKQCHGAYNRNQYFLHSNTQF